jgi:hypothetical protein
MKRTISESPILETLPMTSTWFDPRRPLLFIVQGTIFYAIVATFTQILWSHFGEHKPGAITIAEVASRALANSIGGIAVVALFWWRAKKKLEADSNR